MLNKKTYSCGICKTTPDQISHHKSHIETQKHKDKRELFEFKLSKLTNQELENDLQGILNPIAPSSDFIEDLQNRLRSKSEIAVEYPNYLLPFHFLFHFSNFSNQTLYRILNVERKNLF